MIIWSLSPWQPPNRMAIDRGMEHLRIPWQSPLIQFLDSKSNLLIVGMEHRSFHGLQSSSIRWFCGGLRWQQFIIRLQYQTFHENLDALNLNGLLHGKSCMFQHDGQMKWDSIATYFFCVYLLPFLSWIFPIILALFYHHMYIAIISKNVSHDPTLLLN